MTKSKTGAAAPGASSDSSAAKPATRDWSETLYLPKTDFPMKAGLPEREPELVKRWQAIKIYEQQRAQAPGREKFVLHDGPPYANANIHLGTALNKILKDVVARSQQMLGKDANYVPGWDCHGLPIEWKIEEKYRAEGKDKDAVPIIEFRRECREFAEHWLGVQRAEFMRLGVEGDWWHPYMTMTHEAEALIARELMKFAMNGLLYRGSKPVMWSVVEKTALAEAEVEYQDFQSDAVWVKFPVVNWDKEYSADQTKNLEALGPIIGVDGTTEQRAVEREKAKLDGAFIVLRPCSRSQNARYFRISLTVELSASGGAASDVSEGRICFARTLPSSTPYWSNELTSQITPCVNTLCS